MPATPPVGLGRSPNRLRAGSAEFVNEILDDVGCVAGVDGLTAQTLRRAVAVRLLQEGVDIWTSGSGSDTAVRSRVGARPRGLACGMPCAPRLVRRFDGCDSERLASFVSGDTPHVEGAEAGR